MANKDSNLTTIIAKGLLGGIPFVGPLAAEVVGSLIPNQRIDRIESFLRKLEAKINEEDKDNIMERIKNPESIDLLEDSFIQASRALSEERKDYIASLLKNSLTDEKLKYIEYKKLLILLGDLNDIEILMLKLYVLKRNSPEYNEFLKLHRSTLAFRAPSRDSSQEEKDKYTVYQTHSRHLLSIGLLKSVFPRPREDTETMFDVDTGTLLATETQITPLGRLLLKSIDLT